MREKRMKFKDIALCLGKSPEAVRQMCHRTKINNQMGERIIVKKRLTDGAVGRQIKLIVTEEYKTPASDIPKLLEERLPPGTPIPKVGTVNEAA